MKEAWEIAEEEFDAHFKRMGKRAYVHVFKDARALHGMNKRRTATGVQPSDRLVTCDGETFYAEIKYTDDPKSFSFGLIKPSQIAAATQVVGAGGGYFIFIKSGQLNRWHRVPYSVIQGWPRRSMTWTDLEPYQCTM